MLPHIHFSFSIVMKKIIHFILFAVDYHVNELSVSGSILSVKANKVVIVGAWFMLE